MTLFDVIGNVLLKGMELGYDDNFQANVNLVTGSIRICGKVIMDRYKIVPCTLDLSDGTSINVTDDMELLPEHLKGKDAFQVVEKLYSDYYRSIPGKTSKKEGHMYALPAEGLTFDDYLNRIDRNVAQGKLESFIVLAAAEGLFHWERGWFWQSAANKKLIIYKKWTVAKLIKEEVPVA